MKNVPNKKFLNVDIVIQALIGLPMYLCCLVALGDIRGEALLFALMVAVPFGAWQVLSGIVGLFYKSQWRGFYLILVLFYFLILSLLNVNLEPNLNLASFFSYGMPLVLGLYYFVRTVKDINNYTKPKKQIRNSDDILDVEL